MAHATQLVYNKTERNRPAFSCSTETLQFVAWKYSTNPATVANFSCYKLSLSLLSVPAQLLVLQIISVPALCPCSTSRATNYLCPCSLSLLNFSCYKLSLSLLNNNPATVANFSCYKLSLSLLNNNAKYVRVWYNHSTLNANSANLKSTDNQWNKRRGFNS